MSKIAVIKTGGKQYKVREGQVLKVEKIDKKEGAKVNFETLLISGEEGKDLQLGQPSLGKKTEGKILSEGKGKKVSSAKYKNKIRYHKEIGHRQPFTEVEITAIK